VGMKILNAITKASEIVLIVVSIELFILNNVADAIFFMVSASLVNSIRRELA